MITLPEHSRIWIYQSERAFSPQEEELIQTEMDDFLAEWAAHGQALLAQGVILHHRIIVVALDQNHEAASGCSIDSQVRFIQSLGQKLGVDLMNRQLIHMRQEGDVYGTSMHSVLDQIKSGELSDDTIMFDATASTVGELWKWEKPIRDSWLGSMV